MSDAWCHPRNIKTKDGKVLWQPLGRFGSAEQFHTAYDMAALRLEKRGWTLIDPQTGKRPAWLPDSRAQEAQGGDS